MDRRKALKSIALSTGVAISTSTFAVLLRAAEEAANSSWQPVFLQRDEAFAVSQIADVIIPASETPGAVDVAVPQFIDLLLKEVFIDTKRDKFRKGLQLFLQKFAQENDSAFHASSNRLRRTFVEKLYTLSDDATKQALDLVAKNEAPPGREAEYYLWSFLVTQRELTINSYFTSEKVGEQLLSYDPIPGRYDPCIPASKVGNVYSL